VGYVIKELRKSRRCEDVLRRYATQSFADNSASVGLGELREVLLQDLLL
jgi:hypothetical protein